jgi:predicted nucleic acid-binding Zn ribbon protein
MPYADPAHKKAWRKRYRERQHYVLRAWYERQGWPVPAHLLLSYEERLRRAEERARRTQERKQAAQAAQEERARRRQERELGQPARRERRRRRGLERDRRRRFMQTVALQVVELPRSPAARLAAKFCAVCERPLGPHKSRYCSKGCSRFALVVMARCKRKGQPSPFVKQCRICGTPMTRRGVYCSDECVRLAERTRNRSGRPSRWHLRRMTPQQRLHKREQDAARRREGVVALQALRELGVLPRAEEREMKCAGSINSTTRPSSIFATFGR